MNRKLQRNNTIFQEDQFDKLKEKAYQEILNKRNDEVEKLKSNYTRIDITLETISEQLIQLEKTRDRNSTLENYTLILLGVVVLFSVFLLQMYIVKEKLGTVFS